MLGRLKRLLRGRTVLVPGTERLAEGEARKVDLGDPLAGGRQILLCRVEGRVHALDVVCPHEGGRLVPGPLIEGRYAHCPLHGYRFDPGTGRAVGVACPAARTYRSREGSEGTEVWI